VPVICALSPALLLQRTCAFTSQPRKLVCHHLFLPGAPHSDFSQLQVPSTMAEEYNAQVTR